MTRPPIVEPWTLTIAIVSIVGVLALIFLGKAEIGALFALVGVLMAAQSKKMVRPRQRITDLDWAERSREAREERRTRDARVVEAPDFDPPRTAQEQADREAAVTPRSPRGRG